MIDGVMIKELVTHADERGFFRELIRASDAFFIDGFGQLSHALVAPGVIKAWHGHRVQAQWTYVIAGTLHAVLYDARPGSSTAGNKLDLLLGDRHAAQIYLLPPGVLHGYCCISGPAHVLYVTSGEYDPAEEIRRPPDDSAIGHDWTRGAP